jgi:hypothetical protein
MLSSLLEMSRHAVDLSPRSLRSISLKADALRVHFNSERVPQMSSGCLIIPAGVTFLNTMNSVQGEDVVQKGTVQTSRKTNIDRQCIPSDNNFSPSGFTRVSKRIWDAFDIANESLSSSKYPLILPNSTLRMKDSKQVIVRMYQMVVLHLMGTLKGFAFTSLTKRQVQTK